MEGTDLVEIRLLGPVEVHLGGTPVDLRGRSQRVVLAVLALSLGRSVSVDRLYEALWGEHPPSNPAGNLQAYVSRLRKVVGPTAILREGAGYRLDPGLVVVDVEQAEDAARAGDVTAALDMWRGPCLDGVDADLLEPERLRLEQLRIHYQELDLLDRAQRAESPGVLLPELQRAFNAAVDREPIALALASALWADSRPADGLRVLDEHRRHLRETSGLGPGPEIVSLEQRMLNEEPPPAATIRIRRLRRASVFLGRARDLEQLEHLAAVGGLITVTGPGGVGKTSLVAEFLANQNHAIVVEFDRIDHDDHVVGAVVEAMGLGAVAVSIESIIESLDPTNELLVLDNCEHVLSGVRSLVEELGAASAPTIIATSRQMLGASHERVLPIAPFDTSATEGGPGAELFLHRATRIDPTFEPGDGDLEAVAQICRRLDGMPLAIELAASRISAFTVTDIATQLDDALDALIDPAAPRKRQQTLRATVDWSFQLLPKEAQELLPALSVFSGGFTTDAASGLGASPSQLGALIDANLVVQRQLYGGRRYRLLEPTRQYAEELLADPTAARDSRNAWVATTIARTESMIGTTEEQGAVEVLQAELGNIELALTDALNNNLDAAAAIAVVLGRFGPYYGTAPLFAMIDRVAGTPLLIDARRGAGALAAAAHNTWMRGNYDRADALARQALERLEDDSPDRWMANFALGGVLYWRGQWQDSLSYIADIEADDAAPDAARAGAHCEAGLRFALLGDPEAGASSIQRGLDLAQLCGSPSALAHATATDGGRNLFDDPLAAIDRCGKAAQLARSCGARAVALMAETGRISAMTLVDQHAQVLQALPSILKDLRNHGGWTYLWIFLRAAADAFVHEDNLPAAAQTIIAARADTAAPVEGLYAELLNGLFDDTRSGFGNDHEWERFERVAGRSSRSDRVELALDLISKHRARG